MRQDTAAPTRGQNHPSAGDARAGTDAAGLPKPHAGRCSLPTHERTAWTLLSTKLNIFHQARTPRGRSIPQITRGEPTAATQKPKPRGKSSPAHGHALESTEGFLLLCQIDLASTQTCMQTASTTSSVLLSHYQNHLILIYNVRYMV